MNQLPAAPVYRRLTDDDVPAVRALAASLRRWFSAHDLAQIDALLRERPTGWVAHANGDMVGFLLDAPTPDPRVREL
ncbi:MAG TPA: hypothetical protein VHB98_14930, partial [Chloroflexota bacterium]|nr:hypothetical protein [Chloroflexota bacterium]